MGEKGVLICFLRLSGSSLSRGIEHTDVRQKMVSGGPMPLLEITYFRKAP